MVASRGSCLSMISPSFTSMSPAQNGQILGHHVSCRQFPRNRNKVIWVHLCSVELSSSTQGIEYGLSKLEKGVM